MSVAECVPSARWGERRESTWWMPWASELAELDSDARRSGATGRGGCTGSDRLLSREARDCKDPALVGLAGERRDASRLPATRGGPMFAPSVAGDSPGVGLGPVRSMTSPPRPKSTLGMALPKLWLRSGSVKCGCGRESSSPLEESSAAGAASGVVRAPVDTNSLGSVMKECSDTSGSWECWELRTDSDWPPWRAFPGPRRMPEDIPASDWERPTFFRW